MYTAKDIFKLHQAQTYPFPSYLEVESAKGSYIFDSEKNEILDMMAGLWCVNLGYGRNELAEVAKEQMQLLPYYNTFFKTATTPSIELSRILKPNVGNIFFSKPNLLRSSLSGANAGSEVVVIPGYVICPHLPVTTLIKLNLRYQVDKKWQIKRILTQEQSLCHSSVHAMMYSRSIHLCSRKHHHSVKVV